jgi:hypothetical protein
VNLHDDINFDDLVQRITIRGLGEIERLDEFDKGPEPVGEWVLGVSGPW